MTNPRTATGAEYGGSGRQRDHILPIKKDPNPQDASLAFHVRQYVPDAFGEELESRIALLKARDYAGMIRRNPISEIARNHAIDAQDAANHFFHDPGASLAELKLAVTYCRHLVQAAFLAEHLDPEVWQ